MDDVSLVIENLTKDSDQLKLFFSCKALKNIFLVSDPSTTEKILSRFGKQFLKRLVKILTYDHLQDCVNEALQLLVLLTNILDLEVTQELV